MLGFSYGKKKKLGTGYNILVPIQLCCYRLHFASQLCMADARCFLPLAIMLTRTLYVHKCTCSVQTMVVSLIPCPHNLDVLATVCVPTLSMLLGPSAS